MTATGGGPALQRGAAPVSNDGGAAVIVRPEARRLRMVLGLARIEAWLLVRSVLILAGLLAGGLVIWLLIRPAEPLWWNASWQIGGGQLILAMAVLVAAQLAAGRSRRDSMADLYASYPAPASTRAVAHLAGLAGAAPASLLLLGVAAGVVQARGAIGAPSIVALAGGLLLVIAAGAAGVAIGSRFPHPLAGLLGALVLLLPDATTHLASGAGYWLLPWSILQNQLGSLPGPLAGYPPAGAHAVELAGLALLAGIVAVAATARRFRGWLVTAGIMALAVICFAGAVQLRPIPTAGLDHLVTEVADPASVQRCISADQVRYCLYPGFGRDLPQLEAPVNGVLAQLPARPGQPLTVRQFAPLYLPDSTLTHGHPQRLVSQWEAQVRSAPGNVAAASGIYLPVGTWPAGGAQLTDAHFNVALAAAEWAVRIPSQATGTINSKFFLPCVPVGQAREAIAIWLAILAARPPVTELQDGLPGSGAGRGFAAADVRHAFVPVWAFPGADTGPVDPAGPQPQTTAVGYLLARAMARLPQQKVSQVLKNAWPTWMNWHTTDAQLAAALGVPVPSVSLPAFLRPGFKPPHGAVIAHAPDPQSQSPVCTS